MESTGKLYAALRRARRRLESQGRSAEEVNRHVLAGPLSRFEALRGSEISGHARLQATAIEPLILRILDWEKDLNDLGPDDLFELRSLISTPPPSGGLRCGPGSPLLGKHPLLSPEFVERALSRFFFWVSGPGYAEIHPLEQSVLCQLRLMEISPFREHNTLISIVFSYYLLARTGHLLPTFQEDDVIRYQEALLQGLNFSTTALVDLHLEACLRSYSSVVGQAG